MLCKHIYICILNLFIFMCYPPPVCDPPDEETPSKKSKKKEKKEKKKEKKEKEKHLAITSDEVVKEGLDDGVGVEGKKINTLHSLNYNEFKIMSSRDNKAPYSGDMTKEEEEEEEAPLDYSANHVLDHAHIELKKKVNLLVNKRPQCLSINKEAPGCNCSGWFLSADDGNFALIYIYFFAFIMPTLENHGTMVLICPSPSYHFFFFLSVYLSLSLVLL
jgi:hypothetical protein